MPSLHRLESTDNDPSIGGVLVSWDAPGEDPVVKVCSWRSAKRVDVAQTARAIVEQLIDWAARAGHPALDGTNWVSLTSGVCKHVADWNSGVAGPGN